MTLSVGMFLPLKAPHGSCPRAGAGLLLVLVVAWRVGADQTQNLLGILDVVALPGHDHLGPTRRRWIRLS